MLSFNISFQLFREFCKGQQFNTCQHPGNGHQGSLHSCCANFCPVVEEAKRRQAAEKFNNDITTGDKSKPADIAPVDSSKVWSDTDTINANLAENY